MDIYGVPFSLIPVEREKGGARDLTPPTMVAALPEREDFEITFPRIVGYRPETTVNMNIDESKLEPLMLDAGDEPTRVFMGEGVSYYATGGQLVQATGEEMLRIEDFLAREQTVAFVVARELCERLPEHHSRFLFPRALQVAEDFFENRGGSQRAAAPCKLLALTKSTTWRSSSGSWRRSSP
ncbi:MAG: hypothetical protein IPF99_33535, partial [Deltaproteobacteria bacterium]|nr:hypothetical protein [Deltaproteobacteria bacterium]